jgi:hypothetical protein
VDLGAKKIASPKGEPARERNTIQYNIQPNLYYIIKKIEMLMLASSKANQITLYNLENEQFRRDLHV